MFPVEMISAGMLDNYVGRSDALIIDLRNKEKYFAGHIRTAQNIPYEMLEEIKELPKNKMLVFYCDRGGAGIKAAKLMASKGYRTKNVIGGFDAYRGRNLVFF